MLSINSFDPGYSGIGDIHLTGGAPTAYNSLRFFEDAGSSVRGVRLDGPDSSRSPAPPYPIRPTASPSSSRSPPRSATTRPAGPIPGPSPSRSPNASVNPLSIDIVLAAHTTHARLQWLVTGRIGGTWIPPAAALGGAVS